MEPSPFDFKDYKSFVLARIEASPGGGRGLRRRIAEMARCQVAYVSHVLAGASHFNPEQSEAVARFFSLRADETEFFMLLVDRARAGTPELRQVLDGRIRKCLDAYRLLKTRVILKGEIRPEDQAIYYSSWHYQAIRVLLTIPGFRRPPEIARRLGLPLKRVTEILDFFLAKGLARESKDGYVPTQASVHLGSDSPLVSKLHSNWRIHALRSLEHNRPEDLHYSGVLTLAHADFEKVREIWTKALLESHRIIEPSREERICAMALDFYEL
jgi:uncharacterized protein (TIGR02147 family)